MRFYDVFDFFLEIMVPVLILTTLLVGGIFLIAWRIDVASCNGFNTATGIPVNYAGFECYAQVEGKWVPKKYVFGDAKEFRIKDGKPQ